MHNAVIVDLVKSIAEARTRIGATATLRFNFRGVGRSTGRHSEGQGEHLGEVVDVIAAVDAVLNALSSDGASLQVSIVGYSFGSWVGLRAAWAHPEVERVVLIAPPIRILSHSEDTECRRPLPTEIVVGDRDSFAPIDSVRSLARYLGARLHTIVGADHFFANHRKDMVEAVLPHLAPPTLPLSQTRSRNS